MTFCAVGFGGLARCWLGDSQPLVGAEAPVVTDTSCPLVVTTDLPQSKKTNARAAGQLALAQPACVWLRPHLAELTNDIDLNTPNLSCYFRDQVLKEAEDLYAPA